MRRDEKRSPSGKFSFAWLNTSAKRKARTEHTYELGVQKESSRQIVEKKIIEVKQLNWTSWD